MERRIQRAMLDLEHFVRSAFNRVGDGVAVRRPQYERSENQQIQRALEKITPRALTSPTGLAASCHVAQLTTRLSSGSAAADKR